MQYKKILILFLLQISMTQATPQEKLMEGIIESNLSQIESALNAGARIEEHDPLYCDVTPLYLATDIGSLPTVKLLLRKGANPNTHLAPKALVASFGHPLTEENLYLMQVLSPFSLPLGRALGQGKTEIACELILHGSSIAQFNPNRESMYTKLENDIKNKMHNCLIEALRKALDEDLSLLPHFDDSHLSP